MSEVPSLSEGGSNREKCGQPQKPGETAEAPPEKH